MYSYKEIKEALLKKDYKWFSGELNINIVFIREDDIFTNKYTDRAIICYEEKNKQIIFETNCSTKAGWHWEKNPITVFGITGVAVLKEGQYAGGYTFMDNSSNFHKSPHLFQTKNVTVYRDFDKDGVIDRVQEQTGIFGINVHWASGEVVHNWSAGCIVIPVPQYYKFFDIIRASSKLYGNRFTITLLNKTDFNN